MPVNPMPAAPAAAMITFFLVSHVARHRSLALPPRSNLLPFLGCFINISLSLSLSLSRFFFSSSSSQTWSHYKICCCERRYFQIAGDFSSFLASCNSCNGEVVGALGGSHLGQEQEQDPYCIWFSWGVFWAGGCSFEEGFSFFVWDAIKKIRE